MFRFEKLEIWKMAIDYTNKVYDISETLPKNEVFGLTSQLKRAALSISSNIAEGSGSSSTKDFSHYLDISIKSTIETVSQLRFAQSRKYAKSTTVSTLYDEAETLVKRIQGLKLYLKNHHALKSARKSTSNVPPSTNL